MRDPLMEWLIRAPALKRDMWILECQLYRILLSYINGKLDAHLISITFDNVKEYMNNHMMEKCYENRSFIKILVEECDWSLDMFVNMIKEKKGRL